MGGLGGIYRNGFAGGVAGVVMILMLLWACPFTLAQSTTFEPITKFSVPAYNGVISFAMNGNYSSATFDDNTWIFTNLLLNGSQPLEKLEISAKDSNVTVNSYQTVTFGFPSELLSISVQGKGQQIINMGIGAYTGTNVDWVVASNVTLLNNGWNVSHNGTVTLTGLTGNSNIIYFNFTSQLGGANQPFYEAHSVAIAVAVAFIATVAVAMVLKFANKRRPSEVEESV